MWELCALVNSTKQTRMANYNIIETVGLHFHIAKYCMLFYASLGLMGSQSSVWKRWSACTREPPTTCTLMSYWYVTGEAVTKFSLRSYYNLPVFRKNLFCTLHYFLCIALLYYVYGALGTFNLVLDFWLIFFQLTNAIKNSLEHNPSGQPYDGPMGVTISITPAHILSSLNRQAITNASFKAQKLPGKTTADFFQWSRCVVVF